MTLKQVWNRADKGVESFVIIADKNGYGLISIQQFLLSKGVKLSCAKIDEIRCPYLY